LSEHFIREMAYAITIGLSPPASPPPPADDPGRMIKAPLESAEEEATTASPSRAIDDVTMMRWCNASQSSSNGRIRNSLTKISNRRRAEEEEEEEEEREGGGRWKDDNIVRDAVIGLDVISLRLLIPRQKNTLTY
jgi:hypothetical protein